MSYTKLFNSIISSTIWTEDDQTRIVWITLMAMSDQNGEVQASIPGLARLAGVSVDATESAIKKFQEPDKYSRTKDDEGRRIEEIDGGWALINHDKYRRMASKEDSKEKATERQRRKRERDKKLPRDSHALSRSVTENRDIAESESESEAEAEAEAEAEKTPPSPLKGECEGEKSIYPDFAEFEEYLLESLPKINPDWTPDRIKRAATLQFETFIENGWKDGNGKVVKNWKTKTRNIMTHKKPWSYGGGDQTNNPRNRTSQTTISELMNGKKADIINASELKLEPNTDHE